jgi:citrate lyase beta subunit
MADRRPDVERPKRNTLLDIFGLIESPRDLVNLQNDIRMTAGQTTESDGKKEYNSVLRGIVFGAEDYCAVAGIRRSRGMGELVYVRQKMVALARAFNLQAIDAVCLLRQS